VFAFSWVLATTTWPSDPGSLGYQSISRQCHWCLCTMTVHMESIDCQGSRTGSTSSSVLDTLRLGSEKVSERTVIARTGTALDRHTDKPWPESNLRLSACWSHAVASILGSFRFPWVPGPPLVPLELGLPFSPLASNLAQDLVLDSPFHVSAIRKPRTCSFPCFPYLG